MFWFFGTVNGSANDSNVTAVQQHIQAPNPPQPQTSCLPPQSLTPAGPKPAGCPYTVEFQQNHTFDRLGDYVVSVTAYDGNFDWVIATTDVTVVAPKFSVAINGIQSAATPNGTTSPVEGFPVQFQGACLNGTSSPHNCSSVDLAWNFGDGGLGYGSTVYHSYAVRGTYVVTLTGTDFTTGAMNRSFSTVYVSNLAPFLSVNNASGSLTGPELFGYSPSPSSYPGNPPGIYMFPSHPVYPSPFWYNYTVDAGTPVSVCALVYDFNSLYGPNITFQWRFGDGATSYTRPIPQYQIPAGTPCEPNPFHYFSPLIAPQAPPVVRSPEFTDATHVYDCPGWYNITVQAIDQERLSSNSTPYQIDIHVVLLKNPSGKLPQYNATVGQVDFLNSTTIPGFPQQSAFYNYTWAAGKYGPTYGTVGRISAFRAVRQSVTLTTQANTTALPCCSSSPISTSTYANYFDVKPTVGIDSIYTEASITLSISNTYYYNNLNFTLLENGVNEGWYNMSYPQRSVTLVPINFQMSDRWSVILQYTPYGHSGGTYANIAWNWQYDDTSTDSYDATEPPDYSDTTSVFFSNGNTSGQNTVPVSVNTAAIGEPFTTYVVFFSPAQTNLTETWTMGDGTVYHTSDSAPSTPEPTMSTWYLSYAYYTGSNYLFNVTACDDYHYCSGDQFTVQQTANFTATDTAPFLSVSSHGVTLDGVPNTVSVRVYNQDNASGAASVAWQWGDGQTTLNTTASADGATVYGVHIYRYAAKYALIVTATSAGGSASANWTWITVQHAPPISNFSVVTPTPYAQEPVWFSGANSSNSLAGAVGLNFGWVFGNGHWAGGQGIPAMLVSNTYSTSGTYHVTLIVQDSEGALAAVTKSVTIVSPPITSPYPTIPNVLVTADQFFPIHGNISGTSFAGVPLLNVTWSWGDSSAKSYGLYSGHTYLLPGTYTVSATFTGPGMGVYTATSTAMVYDGVPTVSFPFYNAELYGQSPKLSGGFVSTNLSAAVLGDYADVGQSWSFTWTFGDGSSPGSTSGSAYSSLTHAYNSTGPLTLSVSANGPYPSLGAPSVTAQASALDLPVSSEDGLINAYAVIVLQVSAFSPQPGVPFGQFYGTGCTSYVGPNCEFVPGIGTFNGDNDGDGLTNIQEIMGTVTGFYTNPLDNQTAGDGLPDGSHVFSDSFRGARSVQFSSANTSSNPASVPVPSVAYYGPAIAFNQSRLVVQLTTSATLSTLDIRLLDSQGQSFDLGAPTSTSLTYVLLRASPTWGPVGIQGLSISAFQTPGIWSVQVVDNGFGTGTIFSSVLTTTYWADPGHADPLRQGMLDGRSVTVPLFNCSEPNNPTTTFQAFNPNSFHPYTLSFFPYSETYFKLSTEQGVPYVLGSNGTLLSTWNTPSACTAVGIPHKYWSATATYLGDADFGISPWNPHAAGDPSLTNGMKALGRATYQTTAGKYVDWVNNASFSDFGGPYNNNATITYPTDTISTYWGPLNPTALSTAGDGMPDSQALYPLAPLGLQLTIRSANDPNCYLLAGLVGGPQDIASVTLLTASGQNEPTIYTPARFSANSPSANCDGLNLGLGTVYFGTQNYNFSFQSSYFLPLDNSQSTFTLQYNLWQNQTLSATPPRATVTVTGQIRAYAWANATGSNIFATAQVVPLSRAPLIFVNRTGELLMLPGYGYRYTGAQSFYSFDLNLGSGGGLPRGFVAGTNVILESKASVFDSAANVSLTSNPTALESLSGCSSVMGNSVATGNSTASSGDPAIAGTWSDDVSSSPSCAGSLLQDLLPFNSTGGTYPGQQGEYEILNTTQLELLGLSAQAVYLAPFEPPSGFNSPSGTPPVNYLSQLSSAVEGALNAISGALVAFANFVNSLPALMVSLGQAIIGALSQAASLMIKVFNSVLSALQTFFNLVLSLLYAAVQAVINAVIAGFKGIVNQVVYPLLSLFEDTGTITSTDYSSVEALFDPPVPVALPQGAALAKLGEVIAIMLAGAAAAVTGCVLVNALLDAAAPEFKPGLGPVLDTLASGATSGSVKALGFALRTIAAGLAVTLATDLLFNPGAVSNDARAVGFSAAVGSAIVGIFTVFRGVSAIGAIPGEDLAVPAVTTFAYSLFALFISATFTIISNLVAIAGVHAPTAQMVFGVIGFVFGAFAFGMMNRPPVTWSAQLLGFNPVDKITYAGSLVSMFGSAYTLINYTT